VSDRHENGPRGRTSGGISAVSGDRIRTCDLWVMSQPVAVSRGRPRLKPAGHDELRVQAVTPHSTPSPQLRHVSFPNPFPSGDHSRRRHSPSDTSAMRYVTAASMETNWWSEENRSVRPGSEFLRHRSGFNRWFNPSIAQKHYRRSARIFERHFRGRAKYVPNRHTERRGVHAGPRRNRGPRRTPPRRLATRQPRRGGPLVR
jgi:hypothetical protein